jgi:hypothetical protein
MIRKLGAILTFAVAVMCVVPGRPRKWCPIVTMAKILRASSARFLSRISVPYIHEDQLDVAL